MALLAEWVHGTTVRPEWIADNLLQVNGTRWDGSVGDVPSSDHHGLPRGWGATYRGKRAVFTGLGGSSTTGPFDPRDPFRGSQKGTWFHFAVPTPVLVSGSRATLQRVFVLWQADAGVKPAVVHVWDGPSLVEPLSVASGARGASGTGGLGDLVDGSTKFDLSTPHPMLWSVGVSVGVYFENDGDITFFAAGADFEV
ncbi:MAG: hypothetical protein QOI91_1824 [Solirubrobacteraceae bacterium]|nr:hypothetical protein [Solirubrobacteraceae bacterium]